MFISKPLLCEPIDNSKFFIADFSMPTWLKDPYENGKRSEWIKQKQKNQVFNKKNMHTHMGIWAVDDFTYKPDKYLKFYCYT